MRLIDTHVHLDFEFPVGDLSVVLSRARAAGVEACVLPAYDRGGWDAVAAAARDHADVFPAFGLHPWRAGEPFDPAELRARLLDAGAVAVGEIGLDAKVPDVDPERQRRVFREQLAVARDLDLPVLLHCRGAFDALLADLAEAGPTRGVVHAFSRGPELARRCLDLGLHLGLGGAVTRPRAERARRTAAMAPLDRIVLETDAPDLDLDGVPEGHNEPANVARVAEALAGIRGASPEEIAAATTRNARELFRLP